MSELKIDYRNIDPIQLETYRAIVKVAKDKEIPFIIVGASARDLDLRRKDAQDIVYLLKHFESIPHVQDSIYGTFVDTLEHYDWDIRLAGAHVLGLQLREMARPNTLSFLQELLDQSADSISEDAKAQEHERETLNALKYGLQLWP